jgi:hypothetical protein
MERSWKKGKGWGFFAQKGAKGAVKHPFWKFSFLFSLQKVGVCGRKAKTSKSVRPEGKRGQNRSANALKRPKFATDPFF